MEFKPLVLILAAAAMSVCMAGNSHAELWLKDPTTGCEIWSDSLETDKEVPTWSGSCVDGKASGLGVLVVHDKDGLLLVFNGEVLVSCDFAMMSMADLTGILAVSRTTSQWAMVSSSPARAGGLRPALTAVSIQVAVRCVFTLIPMKAMMRLSAVISGMESL